MGLVLLYSTATVASADDLSDLFSDGDATVEPVTETPAPEGPSLLEEYQAAQEKFSFF